MVRADFKPVWYTIPEFEDNTPVLPYHKEQNPGIFPDIKRQNVHVLARTEIQADGFLQNESIILRITADDYYKVYINGVFAGQGPAPAYPEHYYYNEIDISKLMTDGKNLIAVHCYYQGLVNRVWNSGEGRFALAADVVVKKQEGEEVKTPLWKYQISHAYSGEVTGYDTQFLENFDSRLWDPGWNCMGKEQKLGTEPWKDMVPAHWADYHLTLQPTKMLQIYEKTPKLIRKENPNSWFVDVGQEVAGTLILKAKGKAGQKIHIFCGEELNPDGSVRSDMRCGCRYEETWTLDDGESLLEPYDYKGFRYGWIQAESGVELLEVKVQIRHYPFDDSVCTLETDHTLLNDIFQLCKNTVKYGIQEGYLDCPTREKGQYLGDAIVTARAQVLLTGSTELLRKCIDQFAQTSRICPGLMAVAPGSLMQEIADFSLLWAELLLLDYHHTGDKDFLARYYLIAKNVLTYFEKYKNEKGLLDQVSEKWNLVDWPENLRDAYDFTLSRPVVASGCHNVINALYVGAMKTLTEIENILEYPVSFDWEKGKKTFIETFYREDQKNFADSEISSHSSLHSNIYPLYFGLMPEHDVKYIVNYVMEKGLCCGVMMSYFLLKGLARNGYYEEMCQLLMNESEHGWVNMLREDATTCFEAWGKEQKWNTSLCHPWATAPISIVIEDICGHHWIAGKEYHTNQQIPEWMGSVQICRRK